MEMAGEILGQLLAACVGTAAFSALFGVPKKYWLDCGICGAVGWGVYLVVMVAYQTPIIGTESFLPENILPRWERSEYLFTKFHTFIMGDNYWYAASSRLCLERRSTIPPTTSSWGRKRWRSSMAWIQSRWRSQSGWGSERHIRFRDICLDGSGR